MHTELDHNTERSYAKQAEKYVQHATDANARCNKRETSHLIFVRANNFASFVSCKQILASKL